MDQKGHRGREWRCGGRNRRELILRGKGKRQRQQQKGMGENSDGGEVNEDSQDGANVENSSSGFN